MNQSTDGWSSAYLADRPEYAQEVGHLKYEEWLLSSPDRPYAEWVDEIRASANRDRAPMVLLALQAEVLLGFVGLVELGENGGIQGGLWLITLYVKPAYRARGIGGALIDRCIQEARRLGHSALYLWTDSPELTAYYGRRGWLGVGQDDQGSAIMEHAVTESPSSGANVYYLPSSN